MKKTLLPIKISLQFFASEELSVESSSNSIGAASPQTQEVSNSASVDNSLDDNQLEQEFEKLIKGGKYENAFKKRTQGIIDKRFKNLKSLEEAQAKQQPVLDFLSKKYGIDSSDTDTLLKKMQNDAISDKTNEMGNAEKNELQMRNRYIANKAKMLHDKWTAEGDSLKSIFPDFDFKTELKNPVFSSLLKNGMSVKKAYTAAHSDEILKNAVSGTAKRVAEQTLKSIRAQGSRVAENGLHNGAGIVRKTDVSTLTGDEIRSILKQVENGSKIKF